MQQVNGTRHPSHGPMTHRTSRRGRLATAGTAMLFVSLLAAAASGCSTKSDGDDAVRATVAPRGEGYRLEVRRGQGAPHLGVTADVFRFDKTIEVEAGGTLVRIAYTVDLEPFADGLEAGYVGSIATATASVPFHLRARSELKVAGLTLAATAGAVLSVRASDFSFPYDIRISQGFALVPPSRAADGTLGDERSAAFDLRTRDVRVQAADGDASASGALAGLQLEATDGSGDCIDVAAKPGQVTVNGSTALLGQQQGTSTAALRPRDLVGGGGGGLIEGEGRLTSAEGTLLVKQRCQELLPGGVCAAEQLRSPRGCLVAGLSGCFLRGAGLAAQGCAVGAGGAALYCAGGALLTTAGTAEPLCAIPAAAAAGCGLGGLAIGAIVSLTCDGTTVPATVTGQSEDDTQCQRNERFTPERTDQASGCFDKKGVMRCYSARHHPCAGVHTHGKLTYNQARGGRCVSVTKKAVRCDGPFSAGGECAGPTTECGAGGPHTSGIYEY